MSDKTNASSERSPALDIIRCVACFAVLSTHFLNRVGLYTAPIEGRRMALMVLLRSVTLICVPLFLLLSGYLLSRKKLEKSYYGKLWKTVIIYLLAGAACQIFRAVYNGKLPSVSELLYLFLQFEAAPYGWYVKMYVGLFLMIPFLNLMYHAIPTQVWKRRLIGILVLLTALPGVLNCCCIDQPGWWSTPSSSNHYLPLVPDWWIHIYPLCYYCIGCYLREYGCKLSTKKNLLLLLLSHGFFGLFNLWRSWGTTMQNGVWNEYSSILVLLPAVFTFTFFLNLKYRRLPGFFRRLFSLCSSLSLGTYLVSWIFDVIVYNRLNEAVPIVKNRIDYYFLLIPLVFFCSTALSALLQLIYKLLSLCGARLHRILHGNLEAR